MVLDSSNSDIDVEFRSDCFLYLPSRNSLLLEGIKGGHETPSKPPKKEDRERYLS